MFILTGLIVAAVLWLGFRRIRRSHERPWVLSGYDEHGNRIVINEQEPNRRRAF